MARSAEETRLAKRDGMRARRADPVIREGINSRRRQARERYRPIERAWQQRFKRRHFFRYRAQLHRMRHSVEITAWDLARLWIEQRGRCALTGWPLAADAHLDHVIAICRGGSHEIENLRWLDPAVNRAKRELSDEEFFMLCRAVAEQ